MLTDATANWALLADAGLITSGPAVVNPAARRTASGPSGSSVQYLLVGSARWNVPVIWTLIRACVVASRSVTTSPVASLSTRAAAAGIQAGRADPLPADPPPH